MDCAVLGFCSQTDESKLVLPTLRLQRSPLFRATKVCLWLTIKRFHAVGLSCDIVVCRAKATNSVRTAKRRSLCWRRWSQTRMLRFSARKQTEAAKSKAFQVILGFSLQAEITQELNALCNELGSMAQEVLDLASNKMNVSMTELNNNYNFCPLVSWDGQGLPSYDHGHPFSRNR